MNETKKQKPTLDQECMRYALVQAGKAAYSNEVPIGAVITDQNGNIIARSYNQTIKKNSPLAHAEINAISKAAKKLGDWRLNNCTLYVTLEPCALCMQLIIASRISRVVYGASSPIYGFSLDKHCSFDLYKMPLAITSDIEKTAAQNYLRQFFKQKRSKYHEAQNLKHGRARESKKTIARKKT